MNSLISVYYTNILVPYNNEDFYIKVEEVNKSVSF